MAVGADQFTVTHGFLMQPETNNDQKRYFLDLLKFECYTMAMEAPPMASVSRKRTSYPNLIHDSTHTNVLCFFIILLLFIDSYLNLTTSLKIDTPQHAFRFQLT